MKTIKSSKNAIVLFLLFVVFLTSAAAESYSHSDIDPDNPVVIENCTYSSKNFAENNPRIKHHFFITDFSYSWTGVSALKAHYMRFYMDSRHPKDIYLPTKSDRAPPGHPVSQNKTSSDLSDNVLHHRLRMQKYPSDKSGDFVPVTLEKTNTKNVQKGTSVVQSRQDRLHTFKGG